MENDWLAKQVCLSPKDQFIDQLKGRIIMFRKNETVIVTCVTHLLDVMKPLHVYYLPKHRQRDVDGIRVEQMTKLQEQEYFNNGHCGITSTMIILGQCDQFRTESNQYGIVIVDGQHRLNSLEFIRNRGSNILLNEEIIVKIHYSVHSSEIDEYFQVINKNWIPVPMYNLDDHMRQVVDKIVEWFRKSFDNKCFTSAVGGGQRPHLNLEHVKIHLSNSVEIKEIVGENDDMDRIADEICDKLLKYNRYLSRFNVSQFVTSKDSFSKIQSFVDKCLVNSRGILGPLYLGMIQNYAWIHQAMDYKIPVPENKVHIRIKPIIKTDHQNGIL